MISSRMVGNLALVSGTTATYSSNGRTGVNNTNTSSVQSGTACIDRANGLTIGSSTTLNTYMDFPNLNKTFFQNKNATFYVKYNLVNAPNNSRVFTFCDSFTNTGFSIANLALSSGATKFNYAYLENGNKLFDSEAGTSTVGTIYHLFFVFSTANTQVMTLYKNSETTAQFTGSGNTSSNLVFNNYLFFTIAREMFATPPKACSLILYYANLLPVALTTTQMQNIAMGSLVV